MTPYTSIWEYHVHPDHVQAFEHAYRPDGTWEQLFRRAEGHLRTELLRDQADPLRYITIDRWESPAHWEAFRAEFADEYETIDAQCEHYLQSEHEIGRFEVREPHTGKILNG